MYRSRLTIPNNFHNTIAHLHIIHMQYLNKKLLSENNVKKVFDHFSITRIFFLSILFTIISFFTSCYICLFV